MLTFYTDFSDNNNIWIRLNSKIGQNFYGTIPQILFNNTLTENLLLNSESFGFSDDFYTIKTLNSWYLINNSFNTTYLNQSNLYFYLSNFFNGKTPTNTIWNINYDEGYIRFCGNLKTFGNWSNMYFGCNSYKNINDLLCFRSGGDIGVYPDHSGEYIHSQCRDYSDISYSITSKSNWNNNRITWIKLKKNLFISNKLISINSIYKIFYYLFLYS